MSEDVRILLVSGSTRGASTNTAALRTARLMAPEGVAAILYEELADLPAFNPDDDKEPLHPAVHSLRGQIAAADVVLFCTPEYAGALPGSFKNLIDWTVGGGELYRKPVAWLSVAGIGRGGGAAAELATVLGYVDATVIQAGCAHLPLAHSAVGPDATVADPDFRGSLETVLGTIAAEVRGLRRTQAEGSNETGLGRGSAIGSLGGQAP